jgi:hypothetical protein
MLEDDEHCQSAREHATVDQEESNSQNPGTSSPSLVQAQLIPISVKSADHNTRELAYAAQRYGKAAQRDALDFDAIYNHGLALQELASRVQKSRSDQLRLLSQACDPLKKLQLMDRRMLSIYSVCS